MTAKRRETRGGGRDRAPSTSWVLGRRTAPFVVQKPEPFRPEMLLLIDVGASRMVAVEAVEPRLAAEAVAEWAEPKIESSVTVRVETEDLAAALRSRLGDRADVFVAPTPEVDEAIDDFEQFSERKSAGRPPDHDWADDVPGAAKAGFYEAASRFERKEPWRRASDGHVLGIDAPELGWPGAVAVVLGNAGESFGLTLSLPSGSTCTTRAACRPGRSYWRRRGRTASSRGRAVGARSSSSRRPTTSGSPRSQFLEEYPAHGLTIRADVDVLPRRFETFLSWLASSGRGGPGRLAAARARLGATVALTPG